MFRHAAMNRSYSLCWNDAQQRYVPAPETARRRGRRGGVVKAAVAASLLAAGTAHALDPGALPTGGQVTLGQAAVSTQGATMTVTQGTARAAIDWQGFDIGARGTVNFVQPSRDAIALNRVVGQNPSQIFGKLNANGQVFLLNPNGVLFAPGAQVSAAGMLASTRELSNDDFAAGRLRLFGSSAAAVVNQGDLTAQPGGYVVLTGAQVVNSGRIVAPQGDVRLAAAHQVTLRIDGASLAGFTVDRGTLDALVANHGLVQAEGGRILLTAAGADALAKAVVNNTGVLEAHGVESRGGTISLIADAQVGRIELGGKVDASSANGRGGEVIVTGHDVAVGPGAVIDASGATGGGRVRVGGGWQGADAEVANAARVVMAPGAAIDVGATGRGDGGTAVLWSQDYTGFHGSIAARGGRDGGDGGRVETSSHDQLQALGSVDAAAPKGTGGNWLLDPRNVTIAASGAAGSAYSTPYSPGADSTILAGSIAASLDSGANVTITTGSSGNSAGDITVNAPIAVTGGYRPTLTLAAANDINLNAAISSTRSGARLNTVFTADADSSGAGNVNFGAAGKVLTNGGNFYAGTMSGDSVLARGRDFTMASGSQINVAGGMLDLQVAGAVTLADNSLVNSGGTAYLNSGNYSYSGSYIGIRGSTIASANLDAAVPDLLSRVQTTLSAGAVGSAANPIKVSAGTSRAYATLNLSNSAGSSYVAQIGKQAYGTISVAVGSQANATQSVQIMGDAGGDGSTGNGHVMLRTDGSGVLRVATDDVRTAGGSGVGATAVNVSAGDITFADRSVDTGSANFSASATTLRGEAAANDVGDIASPSVTLTAATIGSAANPIELTSGPGSSGSLSINNNGGSTFLKVVDDNFTSISLRNVKTAGTHSVLFSGGDHIDFSTDGSAVVLPSLSGGASDGRTFGAASGIDTTRRVRSLSLTAASGDILFDDNSVTAGRGPFSVAIDYWNATGVIAAQNSYDAAAPVAQITAADVTLNAQNGSNQAISIGAGGKGLQIAQSAGASSNTLTITTQQGDVSVHELTQNHFKTINLTLNGAAAAQNVAIDLTGPDDIAITGTTSGITLDATQVSLSANNRNFSLNAPSRDLQVDGKSPGSGDYSLYTDRLLKLNGNLTTDGGEISLIGQQGIDLLASVRIDSNADRLGYGGSIYLDAGSGTLSSTGGSRTLAIDTSSGDTQGGTIQLASNVDNRAGAYLAGLSMNAAGAVPQNSGWIYIGGSSYRLNGDFLSTGTSYLHNGSSILIDTDQGSAGSGGKAGDIVFSGRDLYAYMYSGMSTFDASAANAGASGGHVYLATSSAAYTSMQLAGITVKTSGGAGGTSGDITLPRIETYGGAVTQTYVGNRITLNGDLVSDGGAISLSGDVRLANSVRITTNAGGTGASAPVTIAGAGVSATSAGRRLTIDTRSSDNSGGAVSIAAGTNAGGAYLGSLTVDTSQGSAGTPGAISLAAIATEGAQTYSGGSATLTGGLSSNGGNISLAGLGGLTLAGPAVTIKTDRSGGSNAAGSLNLGSLDLNGNLALTIDTTADGGGAGADLALNGVGNGTAFSSIDVAAKSVALRGTIRATGAVTVEARGAAADLTLDGTVRTTNGSIVLAAGRNFINNRPDNTGIDAGTGRYLVYSANPAGSLEGMTGYGKHYDAAYVAGATPSYAGSGNWFLYSVAPVLTVTPAVSSIVYGSADPGLSLAAGSYAGYIDGDTLAGLSGGPTLGLAPAGTLSGAGFRDAGSYAYTLNGASSDNLGYRYVLSGGSFQVAPRSVAVSGAAAANKAYDGSTAATLARTGSVAGLTGDAVTLDASGVSAAFDDRNAGTGRTISVGGYALAGADAGNYVLVQQPSGLAADITPKALSVSGSVAAGRAYDGGTSASVVAGRLVGLVGSETLAVTAAGTFADRNAGVGKNVAVNYAIGDGTDGGLAGNYSVAGQTLLADIAPKAIAVAATAMNKVYDGTTAAAATLTGSGLVVGDVVTFSGSAAFADKNVGTGKAVSVTGIAAAGGDAGNYSFATTTATTADVTARAVIVAAAGRSKVYDGSTAVTTELSSAGLIAGDAVTFAGSAAFADKNVGVGKAVSITGIAATGADAGNYSFNSTAGTSADVTARPITVAAVGLNKVYDGTTAAGVVLSSADVLDGDMVTFGGSGAFADKNVGAGKAVAVSGLAAAGADAGNYRLAATTAAATADVTPKPITVDTAAAGKVYDGTLALAVTATSRDIVAGDSVAFGGRGQLLDRNVGVAKHVDVLDLTASGTDAANYRFATTGSAQADVAARPISVALQGSVSKTEDGRTDIATTPANFALDGVIAGDAIEVTAASGQLDGAAVGSAKRVTVALGSGDFRAAPGTSLDNYIVHAGSVSSDIGQVTGGGSATAAYVGAAATGKAGFEPLVRVGPSGFGSAVADTVLPPSPAQAKEAGDGGASATARPATSETPPSVVATNTAQNLPVRRTFSIDSGGIRLPAGIRIAETDTAR